MKEFIQFAFQYMMSILFVIGIGFLFWFSKPSDHISMATFFWVTAPLTLLTLMLLQNFAAISFNKVHYKNGLPRLKAVHDDKYIFEPSEIFSTQSLVSLFYVDEIERYVGFGKVETVLSETKNLQVTVSRFEKGYDKDYVRKNKNSIILKPTIPFDVIQNALEKMEGISNE